MDMVELGKIEEATVFHKDETGEFTIRFNPQKFTISFDRKYGCWLVMRDPKTGNIFVGIHEPEGMLIQYPCGTKHFIKYDKD